MAKHPLISILMTALVVLCPMQCILGDCFTSDDADAPVRSCFNCCGEPERSGGDGDSDRKPEDFPCGDCFCSGALPIDKDTDLPALNATSLTSLDCWVSLHASPELALVDQLLATSFLLSFESAGHDMRAALSSWIL